jgi:hypothetical protein
MQIGLKGRVHKRLHLVGEQSGCAGKDDVGKEEGKKSTAAATILKLHDTITLRLEQMI